MPVALLEIQKRPPGRKRNAPRIDQVGVLDLRGKMPCLVVGNQVGLAERLPDRGDTHMQQRVRVPQETHRRRGRIRPAARK